MLNWFTLYCANCGQRMKYSGGWFHRSGNVQVCSKGCHSAFELKYVRMILRKTTDEDRHGFVEARADG